MEIIKNAKLFKEDILALLHDAPNPLRQSHENLDERQIGLIQELKENGIAKIPNYFNRDKILEIMSRARKSFDDPSKATTQMRDGVVYNRFVNKPLTDFPEFIDMITDPYLNSIIKGYFGRKIVLAETSLEQLPPTDKSSGSYLWHFDIRGKQIKMMIMLSDVDDNGQHFSFVPKTHVRRSYLSQAQHRFSDQDLKKDKLWSSVINCTGTIGTVLLFDTNGIHRGTRKPTVTRENLTSNFNTGYRHLYPLHIPKSVIPNLTLQQQELLRIPNA